MKKKLSFCMITTFYPPYNFGGDGIFLQRLATELVKRGHKVEVVHCLDSYLVLGKYKLARRKNNQSKVIVHTLKSPFGFLSPFATYQTGYPLFKSKKIRQILDKGFDVIHFHNISLIGGPRILNYGQGIKLYTVHDYWLVCPTHTLLRFNRDVCLRQRCILCSLTYKRPPQCWRYTKILKSSLKQVDAILAPSRFIMDIHHRVSPEISIVHLPNFIPLDDSMISRPNIQNNITTHKPFFLFVGRLEKLKGLQTLIPVFRNYKKAMLLVAGKGSYERRLKASAKGVDNIRFLGHLSEWQLQSLYRKAVAIIVPSIWYENFPLVILEAFRQRTPAIVRNLGAMQEIIEESKGGFVYDTEKEIVEAMDRLLEDPSCRKKLSLRCYQAYQDKWTVDVHLKHYFDLINKIFEARNKRKIL